MDGGSWHCTNHPPKKRNEKKAKWFSEEALQIAEKRREAKGKGGKERYTYLNAEFQRIVRGNTKAFPGDQCKGISQIESCYFHISIFKTQDYSDSK